MTHQPRDKKNARKLNEHPIRMTNIDQGVGSPDSSLSLGPRHHAVRQCLHGPHRRIHRNGYPHAIGHGRFGAGRIQNRMGGFG